MSRSGLRTALGPGSFPRRLRAALHASWRSLLPVALGLLVVSLPIPAGLTANAWHYFALFVTVVAMLVTEPIPGPAAGLIGITAAAILRLVAPTPVESMQWALTGFADSTVWLMFVAFMFALGYQKTGLGRRLALLLVRSLGGRTLGLGYAIALTDLALAPFVPSNTARSGGIVFPIIEGIPALYGSAPGATAHRIGAYIMWTAFATTCVTSSMFLTALAPNLLAVSLMHQIAGVQVTWAGWLLGFLPIGLVLFVLQPILIYWIYPPTVRISADVPKWAHEELGRIGPPGRRETMMALLALLALSLWIFGGRWTTPTAVALLTLCLMILSGVISWKHFLTYQRAWSNLIWFATLITLANGLGRVGFLPWFAATAAKALDGLSGTTKVVLLVVVFFVCHYLFASLTAHTTAMLPVFLTAVVALPELPVPLVSLLLSYSLGLMGILTPYATGSAPLYYGSGYIGHREFWMLGLGFGALYLATLLGAGLPYLTTLHSRHWLP